MGLRPIKGFRDEALSGEWKGYRSSRLGDQWRVIYRVVADETLFRVASITAHDYRRVCWCSLDGRMKKLPDNVGPDRSL